MKRTKWSDNFGVTECCDRQEEARSRQAALTLSPSTSKSVSIFAVTPVRTYHLLQLPGPPPEQ
eukprot:scaffold200344_cov19-Prasinocladus_malaysianus.AAC.1